MRLSSKHLPTSPNVKPPSYEPAAHGIGIVHLGLGAFHRAHQAWYTHRALEVEGGDWRIASVSMRSEGMARTMTAQDNLYQLEQTDAAGAQIGIVGSIAAALTLRDSRENILDLLAAKQTRVVTLTVTEKAYCHSATTGGLNFDLAEVQSDLANMANAQSVPGLLVQGLARRRIAEAGGLTILSCDNLSENGKITRRVVTEFADAVDRDLGQWIQDNVRFPSSMVDRITPAVTSEVLEEIATESGVEDHAAIRTEVFSQWVIEDDFANGRPAWDKVGALLVDRVAPYEHMKLRMLNGTHSLMAYAGHVAGFETVKSCVDDPVMHDLAARHLRAAAATLDPLPGVDFNDYASDLLRRFANPRIEHATLQIATDGSQKMPQRIFAPAQEILARGGVIDSFAFACAAWMRFAMRRTEAGLAYDLNDPKGEAIEKALHGAETAAQILEAFNRAPGLIPSALSENAEWNSRVRSLLESLLTQGVRATARELPAV